MDDYEPQAPTDVSAQGEEALTKGDPQTIFDIAVDKGNVQTNAYNPVVVEPTEAEGIRGDLKGGPTNWGY